MKYLKFFGAAFIGLMIMGSCTSNNDPGIFDGNTDIGKVGHEGSVRFDPSDSSYAVSGGGTNMWFDSDQFHYVWKEASGDVSIAADIQWIGEGVNAHRKACLVFRQDLDTSSVYVDIAVHGDGLSSMQFRTVPGGLTQEIQASISSPSRVLLEKKGDYFFMSLDEGDGKLSYAGGSLRLPFQEPFYIGLGVCSHDNDVLETAIFKNVMITIPEHRPDSLMEVQSTLETIDIESFNRKVIYRPSGHIEAPNWTPDGKTLIYNSSGLLYRIPVTGGKPELIPTGFASRINNDHGISPDGKQLVISDGTETGRSLIYTLPIEGGEPKRVTPLGPSYWHGWSPDGKTLA